MLPLSMWFVSAIATSLSGDAYPTFSEHIAPIVFGHCVECHRPGEGAPFSLTTYESVRKRGDLIADVTEDRVMPPWHAEPGDFRFRGERRLSQEEIDTIAAWVAIGMPEGDKSKMPALPEFESGWRLGKPDLEVEMPDPFPVPADGPDIYRNFAVPLGLEEPRWVRAIEFRPSAKSVVHHSLFELDVNGASLRRDQATPEPGFEAMGVEILPQYYIGGWAVGGSGLELPEGVAIRFPAGASLVLSTHFHPSGKPEIERSKVAIYFADGPPTRRGGAIELPPVFGALADISIPAGEKRYVKRDSFVLPIDIEAFRVNAHAHSLGKEMSLRAVFPDGTIKRLLEVKRWDFNWQEQYDFVEPVLLPKGTKLEGEVIWDNSSANPNNPSDPPVDVRWGRESTDEMGSVTLSYMPAIGEDNRLLWRAKRGHKRSAIATWFFHVAGGPDLQGKFPFNSPFLHQRLGLPKAETFRMIAQTAWRIARPRSPAAKRNPIYAMLLHQFDKNENDIVDVSEIGDAIRFLSVRGF